MDSHPSYLRRDLTTLLVLVVVLAALVSGLWYLEQEQGLFTRLAQQFLTFQN